MKNSQKGSVILIILIIIAVAIGGGIYYFSQKNNLVSNQPDQYGQNNPNQDISQAVNKSLSAAEEKVMDATIRTNLQTLSKKAKSLSVYTDVCVSNDINTTAHPELSVNVNEILKTKKVNTQKEAGINCFSSKDKFAISVESTDLWCADSSGVFMKGTAQKTTLNCK